MFDFCLDDEFGIFYVRRCGDVYGCFVVVVVVLCYFGDSICFSVQYVRFGDFVVIFVYIFEFCRSFVIFVGDDYFVFYD